MRYDEFKGIGEILRKARERKRLSFDDVYEHLKIHPGYLKAMEEEKFDELPGEPYVKPYLESYGKFLGVRIEKEPERTSSDGEEEKTREKSPDRELRDITGRQRDSKIKRWFQVSIFLLVALAVVYIFGSRSGFVDKYKLNTKDVSATSAPELPDTVTKFLMELMAFDTLSVLVAADDKVLLDDKLKRGQVKRFSKYDSYNININPARNCRIFAEGLPLYFPDSGWGKLNLQLSIDNYRNHIDSLLIGESLP
ncbi:MAG: hypothetical protein GF315_12335 [candidate division Zixibacteria bacterium]|nr:hypothetical protein [candidate division Zixibacteria bacterium]